MDRRTSLQVIAAVLLTRAAGWLFGAYCTAAQAPQAAESVGDAAGLHQMYEALSILEDIAPEQLGQQSAVRSWLASLPAEAVLKPAYSPLPQALGYVQSMTLLGEPIAPEVEAALVLRLSAAFDQRGWFSDELPPSYREAGLALRSNMSATDMALHTLRAMDRATVDMTVKVAAACQQYLTDFDYSQINDEQAMDLLTLLQLRALVDDRPLPRPEALSQFLERFWRSLTEEEEIYLWALQAVDEMERALGQTDKAPWIAAQLEARSFDAESVDLYTLRQEVTLADHLGLLTESQREALVRWLLPRLQRPETF